MAKENQWARAGYNLQRMAELARKFPIGAQVKYVGTRGVEKHQGQCGIVVWYQDANGLVIQFEDGDTGTATPITSSYCLPPTWRRTKSLLSSALSPTTWIRPRSRERPRSLFASPGCRRGPGGGADLGDWLPRFPSHSCQPRMLLLRAAWPRSW